MLCVPHISMLPVSTLLSSFKASPHIGPLGNPSPEILPLQLSPFLLVSLTPPFLVYFSQQFAETRPGYAWRESWFSGHLGGKRRQGDAWRLIRGSCAMRSSWETAAPCRRRLCCQAPLLVPAPALSFLSYPAASVTSLNLTFLFCKVGTVVVPTVEEFWPALWAAVGCLVGRALPCLRLGAALQAGQLGTAPDPELPLPERTAAQGPDEDGPQGRPGSKAHPPLGRGWDGGDRGAEARPSPESGPALSAGGKNPVLFDDLLFVSHGPAPMRLPLTAFHHGLNNHYVNALP